MFWSHVTFLRNIWLPSNYPVRQRRMEPVEEKTVNVYYKPRDMVLPRNEEKRRKNIKVKKNINTKQMMKTREK
jgi:hypothetical protein